MFFWEQTHGVFLEAAWRKGTWYFARADAWEHIRSLKVNTYNPTDSVILRGIGSPCHFLLIIVCHDFVESNAPKNSLSCKFRWPLATSTDSDVLLICEWCLRVVRPTAADSCQLNWSELVVSWEHRLDSPQELFHTPFCLIKLPYPLCLVRGELKGRLKHYRRFFQI